MFALAIDERRRRNPVDDGDASAFEREPLLREVGDLGADGRAGGEPRLDRVPVGGRDVERLACDFGAREIGDEAGGDAVRSALHSQRHQPRANSEGDGGDGGRERKRSRIEPHAPPQGRRRSGSRPDGRRKRRDAVGKRARRGLAHSMTADCVAQRGEPTVLGRKRGVFAQGAFEFERPHGVELAVESGVKPQEALVSIGHGSALKVLASKARARASRDMTVPIGASVASAISR